MVKDHRDRSLSFSNFFNPTNVIATAILPEVNYLSPSSSAISSSMASISSSTFYVSCAEDISRHLHQSHLANSAKTSNFPGVKGGRFTARDFGHKSFGAGAKEQNVTLHAHNIDAVREANSLVINELKCKLRENKNQIRENRGKFKGSEWNLELLKGNWDNFVEWRTVAPNVTKSPHENWESQQVSNVQVRIEKPKDENVTRSFDFESKIPIGGATDGRRSFSRLLKPTFETRSNFLDRHTASPCQTRPTKALSSPVTTRAPSELTTTRGMKERLSVRSNTFSKFQSYRSKFYKSVNGEVEIKKSDVRTFDVISIGDDDTLSELSCATSFTTEECDSGKAMGVSCTRHSLSFTPAVLLFLSCYSYDHVHGLSVSAMHVLAY